MSSKNLLHRFSAPMDSDEEWESEQEVRILRHALALFACRGYAATNVREIAKSANLSAPMINYYFKSKEGLYLRLAQLVIATLEERVEASLARASGFREQLETVLHAHLAYAQELPDALAFIVDLTYGAGEGRPIVDVQALYAGTSAKIGEIFSTGISNAEFVAHTGTSTLEAQRAFKSSLNGLILSAFEARKRSLPACSDDAVAQTLTILFRGIGSSPQSGGADRATALRRE